MKSTEYTLYGDLDGMTVAELKRWLELYPDDAVLDTYTEGEQDFFRFYWSEDNDKI